MVSTVSAADGSVTQCIRVVAEAVSRYELNVTVYDQLHDTSAGGALIRFEDYFTRVGIRMPLMRHSPPLLCRRGWEPGGMLRPEL